MNKNSVGWFMLSAVLVVSAVIVAVLLAGALGTVLARLSVLAGV